MSKAKQRAGNKPRRHGHGDPFAQFRLMRKLQPFTQSELIKLNLKPRMAWHAMRTGQSNNDDRGTVSAIVNTALVRCESINPDLVGVCKQAQQALWRIKQRHLQTGSCVLTQQDIQDIEPVVDLHEQLLELSTPLEMERAMLEVLRRAAAGETL